jgi:hypothetical protein
MKEFDPSGAFTREIAHILPASTGGWSFWSSDGSGTGALTASPCKTSASCLQITGTGNDASWSGYGFYFVPRQGYQYRLSGWMNERDEPAPRRNRAPPARSRRQLDAGRAA